VWSVSHVCVTECRPIGVSFYSVLSRLLISVRPYDGAEVCRVEPHGESQRDDCKM